MKLFFNWFNKTLINRSLTDVSQIAFYAGMEAAVEIAKDSPEIQELIRDEIKRDTP